MTRMHSSSATLRIMGDCLIPTEVTQLVGCSASSEHFKGEEIVHPVTGNKRVAQFGLWSLKSEDRVPEDIDGKISEILNKMPSDPNIWADLAAHFKIDIFVGLSMIEPHEGLTISPQSMEQLGARCISLGLLAMYEPSDK